VVVTLTTIPTREESLIKTIQSIQSGTYIPDAIYVNIPEWYPRFNCSPDTNLGLKLKNMGVHVNSCKDYGVLTKLIPTMELEKDPETLIVIIDDDMIYQPRMLEGLVKGHEEFKCPVGYSGIAYPETVMKLWGHLGYCLFQGHGVKTEMLECAFGFLVSRGDMEGFPKIEPMTSTSEKYIYLSDDYLYTKYLEHKGITKKVVCYPWAGRRGDDWSTIWVQEKESQTHALSRDENNLYNFMMAGQAFAKAGSFSK
jgi:hypothetical protein